MDLLERVRDRLQGVGFRADETMTGYHVFEPGMGPPGRQKMEYKVRWGAPDLRRWLDRSGSAYLVNDLEGRVTAQGLCEDAACQGTLTLRYFDEHAIRYSFGFEARGQLYRYSGEKVNIRPWNLPVSHTTCFGRVVEAETGRLVSTSVVFFRLRTIPAFLASYRLTRAA